MPTPVHQFKQLPEALKMAVIRLAFNGQLYTTSMFDDRLSNPGVAPLLNSLTRREIDATDYMALWEAVLDAFNAGVPRVQQDWWNQGGCDMRSLVAETTEAYDGMFEFYSINVYGRYAFDWEWCPSLIDAIYDTWGHLPGITETWPFKLVNGLKAMHRCLGGAMANLDLAMLNNDWHWGPRHQIGRDIEECEPENAQFYGVYGRNDEGLAEWVADVKTRHDALLLQSALTQIYPR